MLITLTQVSARDERDFNEWYNREHIDERVNLPGFHRARRYVAVRATPKYLATYECDSVADLATPDYLKLLANQTPWSQAVMARFTHFQRLTLRILVDQTHGVGGAIACVRFVPDPRRRKALVEWLTTTALPRSITAAGHAGRQRRRERSRSRARTAARQEHGPSQGRGGRVGRAARRCGCSGRQRSRTPDVHDDQTAARFGVETAPTVGTYRLLFGNQR